MLNYTAQVFEMLIKRPAPGANTAVLYRAKEALKQMKDEPLMSEDEMEQMMIVFGKEMWPYWQAFRVFCEQYGKEREQEILQDKLEDGLEGKWQAFVQDGGDIRDYRNGQRFEDAFTPEENQQLEVAFIETKKQLEEDMVVLTMSETHKEVYMELVKRFQVERDAIQKKLDELAKMKRWEEEIRADLYYMNKGFAELEERPSLEKVQQQIDFYIGKMHPGGVGL